MALRCHKDRDSRATQGRQMAHPPAYPHPGDDTGVGPDGGPTSSTPRWMPVLGILVAIAVLSLFVLLHLSGGFGPGAH